MILIKIPSLDADPYLIWKAIEDRRAEISWAKNYQNPPLPKYVKQKVAPLNSGIYNMVRQFLP